MSNIFEHSAVRAKIANCVKPFSHYLPLVEILTLYFMKHCVVGVLDIELWINHHETYIKVIQKRKVSLLLRYAMAHDDGMQRLIDALNAASLVQYANDIKDVLENPSKYVQKPNGPQTLSTTERSKFKKYRADNCQILFEVVGKKSEDILALMELLNALTEGDFDQLWSKVCDI